MRILMIGEYKPRVEGPANVVINLSSQLSKDHDVSVVCFENLSYPSKPGHWVDGKVDVWQERIVLPNRFVFIQGIVQKLKRAYSLRKKVDIHHAHGYLDGLVGLIDKSRPLVVTYHGLPIPEAIATGWLKAGSMETRFYQAIERRVLQRADAIIVLNTRIRKWMVSEQGVDPEKLFVVPNGVDIERFNPDGNRESKDESLNNEGRRTIIFVKRLNEQSGVRYLVQSIPLVRERYPDVLLLLVGEGDLMEQIRNMVNELGLTDNVRFIGRVPNDSVPNYLNRADVYVLPSIPQGEAEETFSLSLIEAMACRKAVIATSIGGSKEIIEGERDIGVLVSPKDPDAIAKAIIELFGDPSRIDVMGENARRYVESKLTWEKVAHQTLQVYEHVLSKYQRD